MQYKRLDYDKELLKLLPKVLRARDFHLYLENGKRLTDLWLSGGNVLLGHKPPRVLGELKNAAERGLFSPFPHPQEGRFFKALKELFPDRGIRLYSAEASMYQALEEMGVSAPENRRFIDPAFPEFDNNQVKGKAGEKSVKLWRPFFETPEEAQFLIPILPWPLGPKVLLIEKTLDFSFPAGEIIPPVLLAPVTRALNNLIAVMKAKIPNRGSPRYPKIEKALNETKSESYFWRRRGIYLSVSQDIGMDRYRKLFLHFLEKGFFIPPSPEEPVILPGFMSNGEQAKLANLLLLQSY